MGHEVQYKIMSNYVHRQWEVTSYLSVQLMWSHIVQCLGITLIGSCLGPVMYT